MGGADEAHQVARAVVVHFEVGGAEVGAHGGLHLAGRW